MKNHILDLHIAQKLIQRPQIAEGMKAYKYLMDWRYAVDISTDMAYQDKFAKFYQMKRFRSNEFLRRFFECMEQSKKQNNHSFASAFESIYSINSSMEISFCSKMIHTFDDSQPIWDTIVATNHFGFKRPYSYCKSPIERCVKCYGEYADAFTSYMDSEEGRALVEIFDAHYPNCGISDVKKIDFILWQDRKTV